MGIPIDTHPEVKVIWGYSWGWGEEFNLADDSNLDKWTKSAIDVYAKEYAGLGGDGIYFQTFTETYEDTQFGLHTSSVKHKLNISKALYLRKKHLIRLH